MRLRSLPLAVLALCAGCATVGRSTPDDREYVPLGELELSALVDRDEALLYSMVDIMNPTTHAVRVEYAGPCAVTLLVRDEEDASRVRWDAERWPTLTPELCPRAPQAVEIPAGTLLRLLGPAVEEAQILGDSLPGSEYDLAVRFRMLHPNDTTMVLRAGPERIGRQ